MHAVTITLDQEAALDEGAVSAALEQAGVNLDELDDYDLDLESGHIFLAWYEKKWGVDGSKEYAAALSKAFPDAVVQWHDEWDGHDLESEAGEEAAEYRAGRLTRTATTELVWTDAPDEEHGPRIWTMHASLLPENHWIFGEHTVAIVDEQAGGIIAYVGDAHADRVVAGLRRFTS